MNGTENNCLIPDFVHEAQTKYLYNRSEKHIKYSTLLFQSITYTLNTRFKTFKTFI